MGRKIDIDDIIGGADIADIFGFDRAAVSQWESRYEDFPLALKTVNREKTKIWNRQDILAWGRLTNRIPLEEGHIYDSRGYDVTQRGRAS